VGVSGDGGAENAADGTPTADGAAAADDSAISTSNEQTPPTNGTSAPAPQNAAVAVAAPVFAISDLIRSAADQASATWKSAALPTQRRESPATPFRAVAAPAPAPAPAAPVEPAPARGASSPTDAAALSPASASPGEAGSPALFAPTGAGASPAAFLAQPAIISPAPGRTTSAMPTVPSVPTVPAPASSSPASIGAFADPDQTPTVIGPIVASEPAPPAPPARALADREDPEDHESHWRRARRQLGLLAAIISLLALAVLLGHRFLPEFMGFGSLVDTFLPWTVAPLVLALPVALVSLKKWAIGICLLTCAVWAGDFGPTLLRSGGSGPADIRILSQNVSAGDNSAPDLTGIAQLAEQRGADIVVLQGMAKNVELADQAAPARYGYHLAMYEFVVWSRFKIDSSQPVDLTGSRPSGSSQSSAAGDSSAGEFSGLLRFTVDAGQGRHVTVYAVHLPQPSLSHDGFGVARGDALEQLVDDVQNEKSPSLIVVGDLDVAQTDREIRPLLGSGTGLVSAQAKAGTGFGFTWPATFPVVRLDDVLTRGLTPVASAVLAAVGPKQAHRPIEADLKF
jgi:vancomycin resistance protein VanJ